MRLTVRATLTAVAIFAGICGATAAETSGSIALPAPKMEGGMPLMSALKARHSAREFSSKALPPQVLSNLLWAAFGVNRPDGKRTAPSACNYQEIAIYIALPEGLYRYDAANNRLDLTLKEDLRAAAGRQAFTAEAPLDLIYVADFDKMRGRGETDREGYAAVDTGFISQNVYLFCASEGLSTVVLGWVDKEGLAKKMKLGANSRVMFTQPVGYPK